MPNDKTIARPIGRVDSMVLRIGPTPKPRPQSGDRKTDGDGVVWVRRPKLFRQNGRVVGYDCTGGRQRYVWERAEAVTA